MGKFKRTKGYEEICAIEDARGLDALDVAIKQIDKDKSEKYKEETKMRDNGNDIILLGDVVKEMTSRVTDGDQFYIDIEGLQNKKDLDVKKILDAVSKYREERKDGKS